jgi:hypothetical protein
MFQKQNIQSAGKHSSTKYPASKDIPKTKYSVSRGGIPVHNIQPVRMSQKQIFSQ